MKKYNQKLQLLFERNKKGFYICTRIQGIPGEALKEKWQSGRMRQS